MNGHSIGVDTHELLHIEVRLLPLHIRLNGSSLAMLQSSLIKLHLRPLHIHRINHVGCHLLVHRVSLVHSPNIPLSFYNLLLLLGSHVGQHLRSNLTKHLLLQVLGRVQRVVVIVSSPSVLAIVLPIIILSLICPSTGIYPWSFIAPTPAPPSGS